MKLGIAYNLFDGEELLLDSLKCVRESADYICVIYQNVSNWGEENSPEVVEHLKKLYKEKWIDDVFLYTPQLKVSAHVNEITKRNIGLQKCREHGCDVFSCMDADELYIPEEYQNVLSKFYTSDFDACVCQMLTYYKTKEYVLEPPENYYVSLFYKIKEESKFQFTNFPYLIDPTRRISSKNVWAVPRDFIQMHHLSYVRNDLKKKLMNSSARINFKPEQLDFIVDYFENWDYSKPAKMLGMGITDYNTRKVDYWP
jgi:glycosyltransferase involved in cell wall biosynthesis